MAQNLTAENFDKLGSGKIWQVKFWRFGLALLITTAGGKFWMAKFWWIEFVNIIPCQNFMLYGVWWHKISHGILFGSFKFNITKHQYMKQPTHAVLAIIWLSTVCKCKLSNIYIKAK